MVQAQAGTQPFPPPGAMVSSPTASSSSSQQTPRTMNAATISAPVPFPAGVAVAPAPTRTNSQKIASEEDWIKQAMKQVCPKPPPNLPQQASASASVPPPPLSQDHNAVPTLPPVPKNDTVPVPPSTTMGNIFDLFIDLSLSGRSAPSVIHPPSAAATPFSPLTPKTVEAIRSFAFPEADGRPALSRIGFARSGTSTPHAFVLTHASGNRWTGYARRYLPKQAGHDSREDVAAREPRALVVLVPAQGAGGGGSSWGLWFSVLRTIEALLAQPLKPPALPAAEKIKTLLHQLHAFRSSPKYINATDIRVKYLEYSRETPVSDQHGHMAFHIPVFPPPPPTGDNCREWIPDAPLLPLLRRLGSVNTIRVLVAAMMERRVIFMGQRAAAVSSCIMAVTSILGHGGLAWQHVIIPVLQPSMLTYLSAPMPYLIGMLGCHSGLIGKIIRDLDEFMLVNIDTNTLMVHNCNDTNKFAPDILRPLQSRGGRDQTQDQLPPSAADQLFNTFQDILKSDKQVWANSDVASKVSDAFRKGGKIINIIRKRKNNRDSAEKAERNNSFEETVDEEESDVNMYIDYENANSEMKIQVALVSFFVNLYGNPRLYMSRNDNGQLVVDKKKYMSENSKRHLGTDPMLYFLKIFSQSQLFEQFAKRMTHLFTNISPSTRKPLFHQCVDQLFVEKSNFSPSSINSAVNKIYPTSARQRLDARGKAREVTLQLTSNNKYHGSVRDAIEYLLKECQNINGGLIDILNVLWVRMRDSKGTSWKHGQSSLQLLRTLLERGVSYV